MDGQKMRRRVCGAVLLGALARRRGWRALVALVLAALLGSGCAHIVKDDDGDRVVKGGPVMALTCHTWLWWSSLSEEERQTHMDDVQEHTRGTGAEEEIEVAAALGLPPVLILALALDVLVLPFTVPIGLLTEDDDSA